MKLIENQIWLEASDWEQAGYKYHSVIDGISKNRKSWNNINVIGKGRETLFEYDSLSSKHKALFADSVKRFRLALEASEIADSQKTVLEKIKDCVIVNTQDVLWFQNQGFVAEKLYKSTLYAKRAAWLRFMADIKPSQIKARFGLQNKDQFLQTCLDILESESVFEKSYNLQYLKIKLVKWNKEGLKACIDGRNGKKNALKVTQTVEDLLITILGTLKKPTAMQVWETYNGFVNSDVQMYNQETGEVYEARNFEPLSYARIQQLVSKPLLEAMYADVHGSNLTYRSKHDRYLDRERPKHFASMVTCDDWDFPINTTNGKQIKLYLFFDVATRYCLGYSWSYEKNTDLFMRGLANMLSSDTLANKMPYELQTESHLLKQLQDSVLKKGELFQEVTILPKNPMAKYAESDIRNTKYSIFKKDPRFAEYFKGRHYAKKESNKLEKEHQNKLKKLAPSEIEGFLAAIIDAWNSKHPASDSFHEALFEQNSERLAFYLSKKIDTTYKNGIFNASNKKFEFGSNISKVLNTLQNDSIEVRFWKGECFVYHQNKYICNASEVKKVQASKLEKTAQDKENEQVFYKSQAELNKVVKEQKQRIETLTIEQIYKQARENLQTKRVQIEEHQVLDDDDIYTKVFEKEQQVKKKTA